MVVFVFRAYECMYICIIHMYMNYVQSINIWGLLVGNYSASTKFANTARHTKSKPSFVTSAALLRQELKWFSVKPRNGHSVKG